MALLLIAFQSNAQTTALPDSIVAFLMERSEQASHLYKRVVKLEVQVKSAETRLTIKDAKIKSYQGDSVKFRELVFLTEAERDTYKNQLKDERQIWRQAKRKLIGATIIEGVIIIAQTLIIIALL